MLLPFVLRWSALTLVAAMLSGCQGDDNTLPLPPDASSDAHADATAHDGATEAASEAAADAAHRPIRATRRHLWAIPPPTRRAAKMPRTTAPPWSTPVMPPRTTAPRWSTPAMPAMPRRPNRRTPKWHGRARAAALRTSASASPPRGARRICQSESDSALTKSA